MPFCFDKRGMPCYGKGMDTKELLSPTLLDEVARTIFYGELSPEEKKRELLRLQKEAFKKHKSEAPTPAWSKALSDKAISRYGKVRRMGLPQADAARVLGITPEMLKNALVGIGVTPKEHASLLKEEREAESGFKLDMLTLLHDAARSGKWQAAKALLEKVCPEQYGPQLGLSTPTVFTIGVDSCETKALEAMQDLERLRKERNYD